MRNPKSFLAKIGSMALAIMLLFTLLPASVMAEDVSALPESAVTEGAPAAEDSSLPEAELPADSSSSEPEAPAAEDSSLLESAPADSSLPEESASQPASSQPASEAPSEVASAPSSEASAAEEDPAAQDAETLEEEEDPESDTAAPLDNDALLELARTDGAAAAEAVNAIEDAIAHEAAIKLVLDLYYTEVEALAAQLDAFSAGVDERATQWLEAYRRAAEERNDPDLPYRAGEIVVMTEPAAPAAETVAEGIDGEVVDSTDMPGKDDREMALVQLPLWQTVEEAMAEYESNPDIQVAQPDYIYTTTGDSFSDTEIMVDALEGDALTSADPYLPNQWYLDRINTEGAWAEVAKVNNPRTKVAVIDDGPWGGHPDLAGNVNTAINRDFSTGTMQPITRFGLHGTHVSGIIAARSNNSQYITGTGTGSDNRAIELMLYNAFSIGNNGKAFAYTYAVVMAINDAVANGARVINLSLGSSQYDAAFAAAVDNAADNNVLVVASAGNEGTSAPTYPSDIPSTLSVIALDSTDNRAYYSNYGAAKWVGAPGGDANRNAPQNDILSLSSQAPYTKAEAGTSMAAPMVTAVAGMMLYVNPQLSSEQVKNLIAQTARDLGAPGKDNATGYGCINAGAAVAAAAVAIPEPPPVKASKVTLNHSAKTLQKKGKTIKLKATVAPANTANKTISWKSSNPRVASVASNGLVRAKKKGTTVITATTANGKKATCKITVGGTPVSGVKLTKTKLTLKRNKSAQLKAKVSPSNATNKRLVWSSSNPNVAKVNGKGRVTAVGKGKAKITVKSQDGSKKAVCTIRVK